MLKFRGHLYRKAAKLRLRRTAPGDYRAQNIATTLDSEPVRVDILLQRVDTGTGYRDFQWLVDVEVLGDRVDLGQASHDTKREALQFLQESLASGWCQHRDRFGPTGEYFPCHTM